jgi:hypothetical protein
MIDDLAYGFELGLFARAHGTRALEAAEHISQSLGRPLPDDERKLLSDYAAAPLPDFPETTACHTTNSPRTSH